MHRASRFKRLLTVIAAMGAGIGIAGVPTAAHAGTYVSPEDVDAVQHVQDHFYDYDTANNPGRPDDAVDKLDVNLIGVRDAGDGGLPRSARINSWFFELDVAAGPLDGRFDSRDVDVWLGRARRGDDQPSFDPFKKWWFNINRINPDDRPVIDHFIFAFAKYDVIGGGPEDGIIDRHDLAIAALLETPTAKAPNVMLLHFYEMDAAADGSDFDGKIAKRDIEVFRDRALN